MHAGDAHLEVDGGVREAAGGGGGRRGGGATWRRASAASHWPVTTWNRGADGRGGDRRHVAGEWAAGTCAPGGGWRVARVGHAPSPAAAAAAFRARSTFATAAAAPRDEEDDDEWEEVEMGEGEEKEVKRHDWALLGSGLTGDLRRKFTRWTRRGYAGRYGSRGNPSKDLQALRFFLHEAHDKGAYGAEGGAGAAARTNVAFCLVTQMRSRHPKAWDCSREEDRRAVRRLFLAVQKHAAAFPPSPDVIRPFSDPSTFELGEACGVDVERVLRILNAAAGRHRVKLSRSILDESGLDRVWRLLIGWSRVQHSIVEPDHAVVAVNRCARLLALAVQHFDFERRDPSGEMRMRVTHRLRSIILSWHRMTEVFDAFPNEAAHMLVGPADLAAVTDAYMKLAANTPLDTLGSAVLHLCLLGKQAVGYQSAPYKDRYLAPKASAWPIHRFAWSRRAVKALAARLASEADDLKATQVAHLTFALGSILSSGASVDPKALREISRAARVKAPRMNPGEVMRTMWGYKRIRSRTPQSGSRPSPWGAVPEVRRRDYEAVMDRAEEVAATMTPSDAARVIRCWGEMVLARSSDEAIEARRRARREKTAVNDEPKEDPKTNDTIEDEDDDWTPPTREALESRLSALSSAATRSTASLTERDLLNLFLGWAALVEHHPTGALALDPVVVEAAAHEVPRLLPRLHRERTTRDGLPRACKALASLAAVEGIEIDPEVMAVVDRELARFDQETAADSAAQRLVKLGIEALEGLRVHPDTAAEASADVAAAAGHLGSRDVSRVLRAWARLANHESWFVDDSAWGAVVGVIGAPHGSCEELDTLDMVIVEEAMEDMTKAARLRRGAPRGSRSQDAEREKQKEEEGAVTWAVSDRDDDLRPTEDDDKVLAFHEEKGRWLAALPAGKRAKLETALDAAASFEETMELVVASAEGDATKVRSAGRRAVLEAAARVQ